MEVPADVTPLSEPPSSGPSSREGFVGTMKREREGAPCPQFTWKAPPTSPDRGRDKWGGGLNP